MIHARAGHCAVPAYIGAQHGAEPRVTVVINHVPQGQAGVFGPAVRRDRWRTVCAQPHVQRQHNTVRIVLCHPLLNHAWIPNCDAAHHAAVDAGRQPGLKGRLVTDAAAKLQRKAGLLANLPDHGFVLLGAGLCTVEVDHVQVIETQRLKSPGDGDRVFAVFGLFVEFALV